MKLFLFVFLLFSTTLLKAQHDSSYYYSYKSKITARIYFSNKSTSLFIKNIEGLYRLHYKPNTTNNIGVGATYKSISINLAYGFGFLNPTKEQGKTHYLDLQFHSYGRKFILDVFGQFYKGFYMFPKGHGTRDGSYYLRPDLRINEAGASVQYVFNSQKFSYRASFLQNEWQRKSAGTFLLGFETYIGNVIADSTIFPTELNKNIAANNFHRINFFQLGPSLGYAYTLVIKKHFFMTAAATTGIDLGNTTLLRDPKNKQLPGFSTNTLFRASVGYNSYLWAVSLFYTVNNVRLAYHPSDEQIRLNTANLRLNFIRRIAPGKKVKRYLKVIQ